MTTTREIETRDYGFVMESLQAIADRYFDGHFTVMKFTTNWRVGFGTPNSRCDIEELYDGFTLFDAYKAAMIGLIEVENKGTK